jgi:hypothetical protein
MTQYHKFTVEDVNNLIPFERDLYVTMLADKIKEMEQNK